MQDDALPLGWTRGTVGEHCTLLNGLAFKPENWSDFGLPIIRIQNLNGSQEFNRYNRPIAPAYIVEPQTLLFSWSGNRGTSFGPYRWPGPKGLLNQHIFKVTPKGDIDPDWFFYALNVVRERAERAAHGGSGLVHVRRGDLLGYEVPTPPLSDQRRIAEILDTLEETIRRTEQVTAKLQRMKQGLLHDLLTRGLDGNGELRDPEGHPEQFKDSHLGRVPKEWNVFSLQDITTQIVDGFHHTPSYVSSGVPFLTVENLTRGHGISFEPCRFVSRCAHNEYIQRVKPQPGDVLVSKDGTLGIARVVPVNAPEFSIFVSLALLRPRMPDITSELICTFFVTDLFFSQLRRFSTGTGLDTYPLRTFSAVPDTCSFND